MAIDEGSGTALADALPLTLEVKAVRVKGDPVVPMVGVTFVNERLRPSGLPRSVGGITLEVNVSVCPGLALLADSVNEVPEPKVESKNEPDR